jgi:hypothetical protein
MPELRSGDAGVSGRLSDLHELRGKQVRVKRDPPQPSLFREGDER